MNMCVIDSACKGGPVGVGRGNVLGRGGVWGAGELGGRGRGVIQSTYPWRHDASCLITFRQIAYVYVQRFCHLRQGQMHSTLFHAVLQKR